jgi:hypothetical protein
MINLDPMVVSLISLVIASITSVVALYLVKTRPDAIDARSIDNISHLETEIGDRSSEVWESWNTEQFFEFLSGFLLDDEIEVVKGMVQFIQTDQVRDTIDGDDCGWRNKHRIIGATGVPQRIIYSRNGILERLVSLGMIEVREASSGWGKQKYHYRLNPQNQFVAGLLNSTSS